MVLTYPQPPLLSEITQVPSRDGSSIRTSETQTTAKETAAPSPKKSTARQIVLTIILCAGLMFSCLDASIVSTALVSISVELQDYHDTPWGGAGLSADVYDIPFGALAVLGIYALWPEERRNKYNTATALAKIDFLGNLLLAAASILLVFGMQEAGSLVWSWSSPVIVGALATAGACWILLTPPSAAGTHLAPMLGACALGSFLGGALSKHTNRTVPTAVVGGVLQVVGVGLLAGFSRGSFLAASSDGGGGGMGGMRLGPLLGFTAIYGLGVGLGFAACTMIAAMQACGPGGGLAAAQGAVAQARVFGGALGLAACTVLLDGRLREGQVRAGLEGEELEKVQRSLMAVLELPEGVRREVVRVYLSAFGGQMLLMVVVAVVGLVASFGMYKSKPGQVVEGHGAP
ncbi:hypothetical protein CHGG_06326 [Chaetomium globosum CBS 148.51]|uniref:Major facilitator superfamily (MFS) profile domain-containing protein n=1 Tax=Chaetomium globosum (strain ATCC 6205 / CBS 148.51 / DSM 1962 / NBRC 6347 / NRRL 1970) TaxID=306901 RepID=Q2H4T9_CHAGB|nr:uncharacterized protein CHGG_06326 [Chaetomium globosum CBS 148.51]EAQ89707.1 hypothetical protein CHGG_06326 [Chaetomium globosum CBS 148.51]